MGFDWGGVETKVVADLVVRIVLNVTAAAKGWLAKLWRRVRAKPVAANVGVEFSAERRRALADLNERIAELDEAERRSSMTAAPAGIAPGSGYNVVYGPQGYSPTNYQNARAQAFEASIRRK